MGKRKNEQVPVDCVGTSGESVIQSRPLAARLRDQIIDLARRTGTTGLTINEADRRIPGHKGNSISPRFAELLRAGLLVRRVIGQGTPTKQFSQGAPVYCTRFDEKTHRNVVIHWVPEFAPVVDVEQDDEPVGAR